MKASRSERAVLQASAGPLVSVCIPTYDGGRLIGRALDSVGQQDYPRIEVVVVDDASADDTVERVRSWQGRPMRLFVHPRNLGHNATWNETVMLARGDLVKFLHQDDWLEPDCVSRMVESFKHPSVGIACSRRRIERADFDEGAERHEQFATLHKGFERLEPLNPAPALFEQLLANGFRSNWIGEPSSVMVRRSCLDSVGGFSVRTRHWTDFDLWLRVLAHYDAAFIDQELSTYRRASDSLTAQNATSGAAWLDRLWIIENLMTVPAIRDRYPELARMRQEERHMAWRTAVRGMLGMPEKSAPPKPWIEYLGYRIRGLISPVDIAGRI